MNFLNFFNLNLSKSELLKIIFINICFGISYMIGVQLSVKMTAFNGASAIWLPSGITLAAILLFGSKVFFGIAFGSIMGLINYSSSLQSFTHIILINTACILANYLQPLLIKLLIQKYANMRTLFTSIRGVTCFILFSSLMAVLAPIIVVNTAVYIKLYSANNYWNYFFTMWSSGALAHIIFAPIFLIPTIHPVTKKNPLPRKIKALIIIFIFLSTMLISWLTFWKSNALEYLFLLLLIISVFTLGKKFSIIMVVIVSCVTIIATMLGFGPFVKQSANQSLLLLQSFIGVFAVTCLILSAIIDEKQRATNTLEAILANLENSVKERTAELQKVNDELSRLAHLDGLTQIANRRQFDDYLVKEWKRHLRKQEFLALILIDIDYFKRYNDCYGHQGGDNCLIEVAQTITKTLKRPMDLATRYGGEEFAVILPNTKPEGALVVAEHIREAVFLLKIPHIASTVSQYVTLSLGVASLIPTPEMSWEDLISIADRALYQAKHQGRNRIISLSHNYSSIQD